MLLEHGRPCALGIEGEIDPNLPWNQYFEWFGPRYRLEVVDNNMDDLNKFDTIYNFIAVLNKHVSSVILDTRKLAVLVLAKYERRLELSLWVNVGSCIPFGTIQMHWVML